MDFSNIINSLTSTVGGQLPGIALTLVILIVGLWIAKIIRRAVNSFLGKAQWMNRLGSSPEQRAEISGSISSLVYYLVVLNVLLVVLEQMGITSVLDPLKNLANNFLAMLPNIIGAGIIFYAGWVIAKLCAGLVEMAAGKLDDAIAAQGAPVNFKTSKFLGAFTLGAVLLPITVAGFDTLKIKAISVPAISMIQDLMLSVPKILGAGLILGVSYGVGKFVIFMLSGLLEGMNLNALPPKMGIANLLPEGRTFVETIGSICMFFIMLTATTAAIDKLNVPMVSSAFSQLLHFGGGVLLGGVILMIGSFLATIAYDKINAKDGNQTLAGICRFAILGLVLAMGLKSMGLADNIVNMAFAFTFGSVALAAAIAFGWGGKDAAKTLTADWAQRVSRNPAARERSNNLNA